VEWHCWPSNHRNKDNIYDRGLQLLKWDVVNSRVKEMSIPERGMCPWCVCVCVCVCLCVCRWIEGTGASICSCAPGIKTGLSPHTPLSVEHFMALKQEKQTHSHTITHNHNAWVSLLSQASPEIYFRHALSI